MSTAPVTGRQDEGQDGWRVVGASIRGPSHERRNLPNQDAFGWRFDAAAGATLLAAADGHGAARHHRSDVGARLAVAAALDCLSDRHLPLEVLPFEIVTRWRAFVLSHVAGDETDDWILPQEEQFIAHGTTLLAARIGRQETLALQIGDGDIVFADADNRIWRPLPDDVDTVGESTHSLCEPNAAARFRGTRFSTSKMRFLMLSTDGVGKSFASERDLFAVARSYHDQRLNEMPEPAHQALEAWLAEVSRRGSGDDATLLMANRLGDQYPLHDRERT